VMVYSIATGSKEYINFAKEATAKEIGTDRFEFEAENDAKPDTGAPSTVSD